MVPPDAAFLILGATRASEPVRVAVTPGAEAPSRKACHINTVRPAVSPGVLCEGTLSRSSGHRVLQPPLSRAVGGCRGNLLSAREEWLAPRCCSLEPRARSHPSRAMGAVGGPCPSLWCQSGRGISPRRRGAPAPAQRAPQPLVSGGCPLLLSVPLPWQSHASCVGQLGHVPRGLPWTPPNSTGTPVLPHRLLAETKPDLVQAELGPLGRNLPPPPTPLPGEEARAEGGEPRPCLAKGGDDVQAQGRQSPFLLSKSA